MATPRAIDEAQVRQRIGKLAEAIRAMDLEAVMSNYTPEIVSFDIEPPLHVQVAGKRKNWNEVFAMYESPLSYEIRDLSLTVGDDVAFGHSFNRLSGKLKGGNSAGFWLRWTVCLRKFDDNWLIAHDHVSVPLDVKSGSALLDFEP
jgi:ketosteroid isomerase-like protein